MPLDRRLLLAAAEALARAPLAGPPGARASSQIVVGVAADRGRRLEVTAAGPLDVVAVLAPVAGEIGAELVVRQVESPADPAIRRAARRGRVLLATTPDAPPDPSVAPAAA